MASHIDRNGLREIQFSHDGKSKVFRMGRVSQTQGDAAKLHIAHLEQQALSGDTPNRQARLWLDGLSDKLHKRLSNTGLVERRIKTKLGPFIDQFIEDLGPEFKPATVVAWKYGKKSLVGFFGADRDIRTITEGDAKAYRAWLIKNGKAEATVRRRCGHAKNMMGYALRCKLIEGNPFGNKAVPTASPKGKTKTFVDDALSRRILEKLPDARWRAIWALARWGGVRVPSEIVALRWDGVDFDAKRLIVHSPKTERYDGQESRTIPLFPELERALVDWYHVSYDQDELVFPGASTNGTAYRKTLIRAIKRAGGKQWLKLWTSVRATRRTELKRPMANGLRLPDEAVNAWMGHGSEVGTSHYGTGDQIIESAFAAVIGEEEKRSKRRSSTPQSTGDNGNKKPRFQPEKLETGVSSWPTGTVPHWAIALLFKRLCQEQPRGAAKGAERDEEAFRAAVDALGDSERYHVLRVIERLQGTKSPNLDGR